MKILFALPLFFVFQTAFSQTKTGTTPNGTAYTITKDVPGRTAQNGDVSKIHIAVRINDSTVFDSKTMNDNKPVSQPIHESLAIADLMQGFMLMSEGDKAIFSTVANKIFTNEEQRPPFIKADDMMYWVVEMVELKSKEEIDADNKEILKEEQQKLKSYIQENKLQATQTKIGDYVIVTKRGKGTPIKEGEYIYMNYTGYLLDGTVFDSNVDPKFKHVEEFEFPLGRGAVIKGWDQNLAGYPVGSKLKLIINSANAYGEREMPGNDLNPKGIPANSPLIFDVVILGSRDAPETE